MGTLYIGKSRKLRTRLYQFWEINYQASWFLWVDPVRASRVLEANCRTQRDVEDAVGNLTVKVAFPLRTSELSRAERALLFWYLRRYAELPPLNFNVAGEFDKGPTLSLLSWADKAFE